MTWQATYRDNVVSVYRYMYAGVGNRSDAEDLTSETFLVALPHLRVDASAGERHNYLMATARTTLADHWRRRFRLLGMVELRESVATRWDEVAPDVTDPALRLKAVLAKLPDSYRRVLELRFLEGASIKETARRLGTTVGNAKILQFRALRRASCVGCDSQKLSHHGSAAVI